MGNKNQHINQIPKYTRVVPLPAGVQAPEGMRVAYVRPRYNGAILHDPNSKNYAIMELSSGRVLRRRYPTTAQAGARVESGIGQRGKRYAQAK